MMVLPEKYRGLSKFGLGDSPNMADSGLQDVLAKRQVATCGAFDILNRMIDTIPREGKIEIMLDGSGQPGCAIKFWKVDTKLFDEMDEQFARDEACSDLEEWKSIHEAYFRRQNCFAPDMKVYRMYFDVVEVFESPPENEDNG